MLNVCSYEQLDRLLQQQGFASSYNPRMFFKTKPGEYAAHDQFLGIKNPLLRQIAQRCKKLSFDDVRMLLESPFNEYRLLALFILVDRYQRSNDVDREKIYRFYMDCIDYVNNWNLVDASAHYILGAHHFDGKVNRLVLDKLINSSSLWNRRIAIIATWYHIRKNSLDLTLELVERVFNDKQDLIHKAAGWMLRELGKKDEHLLRMFLEQHRQQMPRTMLRYAIERLPDKSLML